MGTYCAPRGSDRASPGIRKGRWRSARRTRGLGICQFHTAKKPSSQREALATLLAAEKLFAAEAQRPAGPLAPRWGRSSCLTFIGRTYELLGQQSEAAAYFRKALAEHPADHEARDGLARVAERK